MTRNKFGRRIGTPDNAAASFRAARMRGLAAMAFQEAYTNAEYAVNRSRATVGTIDVPAVHAKYRDRGRAKLAAAGAVVFGQPVRA